MATKRMISRYVIDTDQFLDMPASAQALYMHLLLRADDDGFISSPMSIMRMVGGSKDDMRLLVGKGYLISYDSGVVVIRHWLIHNSIREKGYTPTMCRMEAESLYLDDNRCYTTAETDIPFEGAVYHKQDKYTKKSLRGDLGDGSAEIAAVPGPVETSEEGEAAVVPQKKRKAKKASPAPVNPVVTQFVERWNQIMDELGYEDKKTRGPRGDSQAHDNLLSELIFMGAAGTEDLLQKIRHSEMLPLKWFTLSNVCCDPEKIEKLRTGAYDKAFGDQAWQIFEAKKKYSEACPQPVPQAVTSAVDDDEWQSA